MAIEKPMIPFTADDDVIDEDINVEIVNPEEVTAKNSDAVSVETEDGGSSKRLMPERLVRRSFYKRVREGSMEEREKS